MKRPLPVVLFQDTAKGRNICVWCGLCRRIAWLSIIIIIIIMI